MKHYLMWITTIITLLVLVGCSSTLSRNKTAQSSTAVSGETLFRQNCAGCHGRDGEKMSWWKPKVRTMPQADVEKQIRNGGGNMPAFGKKLSDKQITDIAIYAKKLAGK